MNERERLIEILSKTIYPKEGVDPAEVVADYLLDNGVIVPPCKVGDTVYRIVEMGTGIHYKQKGRCGIGHSQGYKIIPCEEKIKRFIRSVEVTKNNFFDVCENFGKTVFLTQAEAEKALAERGKQ